MVGQFAIDGAAVVKNEVEEVAVVVVRLIAMLEGWSVSNTSVNVTEVQFLVQNQEEGVVVAWEQERVTE